MDARALPIIPTPPPPPTANGFGELKVQGARLGLALLLKRRGARPCVGSRASD